MQGKNILVTGASQGIGNGVAKYLLEKEANVILVARSEDKLAELAEKYPGRAFPYPYDLSDLEHIENIFSFCKQKRMKLNGMVHAAGVGWDCPIKMLDMDMMKELYDINFFSYAMLCKYFALKKYSFNGAGIVAMSSLASHFCDKGMAQYASSKAAINAFTKTMAKEMTKRRIRVNAIAPGFVDTELAWKERESRDDFDEYLKENQPYGVIPVEQIVYLTEFLLSEKAAYITGTVIPVSAGTEGV